MADYDGIINRLKNQLIEDGVTEADVGDIFTGASEDELKVLTDLYGTYSYWSSVYSEGELETLKDYSVPQDVIMFYREYAPKRGVNLHGDIGLLTLKRMRSENSEMSPGALLLKYGVVTFAVTSGGNAICMDLNRIDSDGPRVILADHSLFCDKTIRIFKPKREILELSYQVINDHARQLDDSFFGFMRRVAEKEIDDVERTV